MDGQNFCFKLPPSPIRLEEEFHHRLERERLEREAAEVEALRMADIQGRMAKEQESARAAAEIIIMIAEDARSAVSVNVFNTYRALRRKIYIVLAGVFRSAFLLYVCLLTTTNAQIGAACFTFPVTLTIQPQELTIAPTPRLRFANRTAIWIEWDRPTVDALGKPLEGCLEYTLYMRGGFCEWEAGDTVLVEYLSKAQRRAEKISSSTLTSVTEISSDLGVPSSLGQGRGRNKEALLAKNSLTSHGRIGDTAISSSNNGRYDGASSQFGNHRLFPAVIIRRSTGRGLFDIRWADGDCECGVRRHRIHRAASSASPWAPIYHGTECHYTVEGMIPEYVIHHERASPYEVDADFYLQTRGAEVLRDKLSRHSTVVTFRTNYSGQGPFEDGSMCGEERALKSTNARLGSAELLDDSTTSTSVRSDPSTSGLHALQRQYLGKGRGRLYL